MKNSKNTSAKIAVINFSGNVGKTTISRTLLAPRLNAEVISIESINSDGDESQAVRGKEFGDLIEALSLIKSAVVDVGASNSEDFTNFMHKYQGSHEDFDMYIVPTVGSPKQLKDTISTIGALSNIGVPPSKIKVVFNMVSAGDNVEKVFAPLFNYHAAEHKFTLIPQAVITDNEIYGKLNSFKKSLQEIADDQTDFKALIAAATDDNEKLKLAKELAIKRLSTGVLKEHDSVFSLLLK